MTSYNNLKQVFYNIYMKILVYGSKGWIGQQFMKLVDEYNTVHGKSRLDNISDVEQELRDKTPPTSFVL